MSREVRNISLGPQTAASQHHAVTASQAYYFSLDVNNGLLEQLVPRDDDDDACVEYCSATCNALPTIKSRDNCQGRY